ncbi:DUF6445 family protein [Pseudoxanthomonas suwonensis]|uniref:Uncharacterized protein n=1 Tax=Pseudoxanthomonas suwonensis TaxID=314722 RepID=A0A0E3Z2C9_9GAMM|nr:DUF6445 family protein [Pseudoxanthomonas suwonensis]AKC87263.1 hypothetical protein WQ53_11390 [Pseudoxanthomonas suwonensis]
MVIEPHPGIRVQRLALGEEGAPLLVIDQLVADPERLVRKAARSQFSPQGAMFPGIRARAPLSYEAFLERLVRPLLDEVFGLPPQVRLAFPMCHYSLVTQAPEKLAFLQRIPHIDSATGRGLATVHYLFHGHWGGTAFYRHRSTGFEYVDEGRELAYFTRLEQESRSADAPEAGYIGEDTALFERIGKVDGVFNRMVVYRRNSLHSGTVDNANVPPPDPLAGRLSINSFIDVFL